MPNAPIIRPYRHADRADCYDICVKTAEVGGDATGIYATDELMGDLFFGPYADLHPSLAFVVDTGERVAGYIVAAPDTKDHVRRYRDEIFPAFAAKYPFERDWPTRDAHMIGLGYNPERMLFPWLDEYPAHLHIDLLPELQGQGFGRRLMDTLRAALAEQGVPAVHLEMVTANVRARAFYDRLGFRELSSADGLAQLVIATS